MLQGQSDPRPTPMQSDPPLVSAKTNRRPLFRVIKRVLIATLVLAVVLTWIETRTSRIQAYVFSQVARQATVHMEPGPNPQAYFPTYGPYDKRLGYTRIPDFLSSLERRGFEVTSQARSSLLLDRLSRWGVFPIYPEKPRSGLHILDRNGARLFSSVVPERIYPRFNDIPPLVVNTLLFIENRELLDPRYPFRNPAVEWDRLARSMGELAFSALIPEEHRVAGGSTLATQMEKYRHSKDGRTTSSREKLRQMLSASLRSYQSGPNTLAARERIVLDYINTVPLAAAPGFGEVNGLGDGLSAWYGSALAEINALLKENFAPNTPQSFAQALAYKQVLSLFIAQRRPAYYLGGDLLPLNELSNTYLNLLASSGLISENLRALASAIPLRFGHRDSSAAETNFLERKGANLVRARLLSLLGMSSLYVLDRLDLTVRSTLDYSAQTAVTRTLEGLREPATAHRHGLYGFRLLQKHDDLSHIVFSFTLIERGQGANWVRVQTDNYDQPFDINEGVKLDLGSTAKLRTLITYLDVMATLFERFAGMDPRALARMDIDPNDRLSRWAADYVISHPGTRLSDMLEAAMERSYSANPHEQFFTGGGLHRFENFDPLDNDKILSLRQALHHSVNLVFIRVMRDIVRYYMYQIPGSTAKLMDDVDDERRLRYLERFADREGRQFVTRFFRTHAPKTSSEILQSLLPQDASQPERIATIYRSVLPDAGYSEFAGFLLSQLNGQPLSDAELRRLYTKADTQTLSLPDRGFIARVHPLELWVANYLAIRPDATLKDAIRDSEQERQNVYRWLFNTRHKNAQDSRIRHLLEVEAFLEIHRQWARMGYPFASLVPSYATALGSSGDRPAALAELMGIIVNDGVYQPTLRVEQLHFAANTPYETVVAYAPRPGERVLAPEVAQTLRKALQGVVENGTARRAVKSFTNAGGQFLPVGGKTGTGDHRRERYGAGGQVLASEVVNRTATFVFFVGERHFGTLTAYVAGSQAAKYKFTSGLPVLLLKVIAPALQHMIEAAAFHSVPEMSLPSPTSVSGTSTPGGTSTSSSSSAVSSTTSASTPSSSTTTSSSATPSSNVPSSTMPSPSASSSG